MIGMALSITACAQGIRSQAARTARLHRMENVMKAYKDSLALCRQRLDSIYNDSTVKVSKPDNDLYRLFTPFTYYTSPAHACLSLDAEDTLSISNQVNRTLMKVYLKRPDLVTNSESHLRKVGAPVVEEPKRQQVAPDIIGMVSSDIIEPEEAPVDLVIRKPNFWDFNGDYYMQFMQNYVSGNWYKGGQSSYSMVGSLTLQANYNNQQKIKWENKLEMKLGFQAVRNDTLHSVKTTEDLLRYTGKFGLQASKKWYYTFQLIAQTQFMRSYRNNDPKVYSDFFSPLKLNASIGMDYNINWLKNRLTGSVHLAPFAWNCTYVDRLALSQRYGVDKGKHHKDDYGSEINLDVTWTIINNVKWKNRLYFYTTYERVEVECENTISFQLNKFLSTNFFFYPRFDDGTKRDDHHGYFQFKEYLSFGFSYSF